MKPQTRRPWPMAGPAIKRGVMLQSSHPDGGNSYEWSSWITSWGKSASILWPKKPVSVYGIVPMGKCIPNSKQLICTWTFTLESGVTRMCSLVAQSSNSFPCVLSPALISHLLYTHTQPSCGTCLWSLKCIFPLPWAPGSLGLGYRVDPALPGL